MPKLQTPLSEIKTGDLLFWRGLAWYARFIRRWTTSPYSHVAVAVRIRVNGHHRLACVEATWPAGIRMLPVDRYLERSTRRGELVDWYELDGQLVDREEVADYCLQQWGKRYASPLQMLWSFGWATAWFRRKLGLESDLNRERYFCSELVASALRHCRYRPPRGDLSDPSLVDPGTLSLWPCLHRVCTLNPQ